MCRGFWGFVSSGLCILLPIATSLGGDTAEKEGWLVLCQSLAAWVLVFGSKLWLLTALTIVGRLSVLLFYAIYLLVLVFDCGYHWLFKGRKTVAVYQVCKSSNVKVLKEGFCTEFISHFYSIIGQYCISRHRGMNFVCKSGFIELKKGSL